MLKLHRTCSGCTYGVTGDGERPVYVIMIHLSIRRCNGSAVSGELDDPAGRLRVPSTLSALPRIFDDSLCNQLLSVLCVSISSFLGFVLLSILYLVICPLLFSTFFFFSFFCTCLPSSVLSFPLPFPAFSGHRAVCFLLFPLYASLKPCGGISQLVYTPFSLHGLLVLPFGFNWGLFAFDAWRGRGY